MNRIEEIRERCDKATSGPWFWEDWAGVEDPEEMVLTADPETRDGWHAGRMFPDLRNSIVSLEEPVTNQADSDFIANAREDIPYLLEILKGKRERLKAYEEALKRSEYDISPCRKCSLPVVCLPDGMSAMCSACWKKEQE